MSPLTRLGTSALLCVMPLLLGLLMVLGKEKPPTAAAAVASVSSAENNGTSVTITAPSGIQDGNLLVACLTHQDSTTISPPAGGWQQIDQNRTSLFTNQVFWKIASGESGNYVFTAGASGYFAGGILRITGHHPGPIQDNSWAVVDLETDPISPAPGDDGIWRLYLHCYGSNAQLVPTEGSCTFLATGGCTTTPTLTCRWNLEGAAAAQASTGMATRSTGAGGGDPGCARFDGDAAANEAIGRTITIKPAPGA